MNGIMIQLTDKAVEKIQQMIQAKGVPGMNLRVYVEGGGCSGMQYGLTFEENAGDEDALIEYEGFKLLVDPASRPLLEEVQLDYSDSLMDSGFKFKNPKAQATCGCGQSFS